MLAKQSPPVCRQNERLGNKFFLNTCEAQVNKKRSITVNSFKLIIIGYIFNEDTK